MTTEHTKVFEMCQLERIQELAENCDNEYYMSAMQSPLGDRERAKRGLYRIQQWINELDLLKGKVTCKACLEEIDRQQSLQKKAVQEIKNVWGDIG